VSLGLARQLNFAVAAAALAFLVVGVGAAIVLVSGQSAAADLFRQVRVVDSLRRMQTSYAQLAGAEARFISDRKPERAAETAPTRDDLAAAQLDVRAFAADDVTVVVAQELASRNQAIGIAWAQAASLAQAGKVDDAALAIANSSEQRRVAESLVERELSRTATDADRTRASAVERLSVLTRVVLLAALVAAAAVVAYAALVIRGMRAYLGRTVNAVAQVAGDLTSAAERQARASGEQAQAVEQVTTVMEQLSRTADKIAGATERTLDSAEAGRVAVEDTVLAMEATKEQVTELARRMVMLDERSRQIGAIAEIIGEITDKTHILALNAAIESAAAGEYGRRFGVVASQVRELADQARDATGQVKTIITEIQSATGNSLEATREATTRADSGAALARQAGDTIEQMFEMVQTISVATQQQREAQQMVVSTMHDLAQLAQQSAANGQESAATASQLGTMAGDLGTLADGNDRRRA
jgi:methyl-accepting chemotaxis protein